MPKQATALRPSTGQPDLVLGASQSVRSGVKGDLLGTTARADAQRAAIREKQKDELLGRASEREEQQQAEQTQAQAPEYPREDVEFVEVPLPNGRVLEFGPPKDVALVFKMTAILGDQVSNPTLNGTVRLLLSVRSIDGKPEPQIQSMADAQKLANIIGDDGLDLLMLVYIRYWPQVSVVDLNALKKTLRTPTS